MDNNESFIPGIEPQIHTNGHEENERVQKIRVNLCLFVVPAPNSIFSLCWPMIDVHYGFQFLSTKYFTKQKVEAVKTDILQICNSL